MSGKIAADVGDKVKFFPRSERLETRADLSRTSQVMPEKTLGKKRSIKKPFQLQFSELFSN